LSQVSAQEFATTKNSVLISLTQPPKNLNEEMSRFIGDWREQNYEFDTRAQLIDALNSVSLQDIIDFYNKLENGQAFGQLLVQMRGTQFSDKDFVTLEGAKTINNIDEFHQSQLAEKNPE
jgi:protease III